MGEPACYAHLLDEFGRVPEAGDVNILSLADVRFAPAGRRVLAERVWPAGVEATDLGIDLWVPQLAPTVELDDWFDGDRLRWPEFVRRYRAQLEGDPARSHLEFLKQVLRDGPVVLLYSAGDREHNAALVLEQVLLSAPTTR
jgi:uncharacterized protein YeaO (DUF488 family)